MDVDPMDDVGEFVVQTLLDIYGDAPIAALDRRAAYPVTIMSPTADFALQDATELEQAVTLLRTGFRAEGIVTVKPQIRTVFFAEEGMAIVSTRNTRLGSDGEDLGAHLSTYIVRNMGGWRFRALSVNDEAQDDLRERIERLLESEGVMTRLPNTNGEHE